MPVRPLLVLLAVLALPLLALSLGGCGGDERDLSQCASYSYIREQVDEKSLLRDEKAVRTCRGVAAIRTRLENGNGLIIVHVEPKHDIAVREKLIELGYHRRY